MGKITSHMKKQIELLTKTFKNPQAVASLYHWLETELAYTSNHIEGNTLTRQETALVISGIGIQSGTVNKRLCLMMS